MTAVHQFHPTLALADAMSNHVFALRDRLRSWGYESDAFAVDVKPGVESEALSYRRLFRSVKPDDTLPIGTKPAELHMSDGLVLAEAKSMFCVWK